MEIAKEGGWVKVLWHHASVAAKEPGAEVNSVGMPPSPTKLDSVVMAAVQ